MRAETNLRCRKRTFHRGYHEDESCAAAVCRCKHKRWTQTFAPALPRETGGSCCYPYVRECIEVTHRRLYVPSKPSDRYCHAGARKGTRCKILVSGLVTRQLIIACGWTINSDLTIRASSIIVEDACEYKRSLTQPRRCC